MGYGTEYGPDEALKDYGLVECTKPGYPARTVKNVKDSHITIVFTASLKHYSMGSSLTIASCEKFKRPCLVNPPSAAVVVKTITDLGHGVRVVNIAGSRKSKLTAQRTAEVRVILAEAFGILSSAASR